MHLTTLFKQLTDFERNLAIDIRNKAAWPTEWKRILIKRYDRFPSVKLTDDLLPLTTSLSEVLEKRHSNRKPTANNLSLQQLSTLLYYSAGLKGGVRRYSLDTPASEFNQSHRFYPSGGRRYPLEVYVGVRKHGELASALYHYNVMDHSLEKIFGKEEISQALSVLGKEYRWIKDVDIFILTSAVFQRGSMKYDTFAYNLTLTEAGHLSQNLLLTSTALGIKSCPLSLIGDVVHDIYDLDNDEVFINLIPVFT